MANPRYQQPQQQPDRMTKQLGQLAALRAMGGDTGFRQQQLGQNDQQSRLSAALHLLGLQQQQEQQTELAGFHQSQLGLEGDRNKMAMDERQAGNRTHLASSMIGLPGMTANSALKLAGVADPAFGQVAEQQAAEARAQAIERTLPGAKMISDPNAREMFARSQLGQYPGAYEEMLARLGQDTQVAPTPGIGGLTYTGPSIKEKGILGVLADPGVPDQPKAGTSPMADSPMNPFNFLFGNDNAASNYLRKKNR